MLAEELALSRHHLSKILQRLASAGIVATRRGVGGGATLARPADEIRLGDVVRLLEQDQALVECLTASGTTRCTLVCGCQFKGRLRAAEAAFLDQLNRSTLADVALPRPKVG